MALARQQLLLAPAPLTFGKRRKLLFEVFRQRDAAVALNASDLNAGLDKGVALDGIPGVAVGAGIHAPHAVRAGG